MSAAFDLRGVGMRYGQAEVLSGVDLHLSGGVLTAVVGPNGAGKSTLLGHHGRTSPRLSRGVPLRRRRGESLEPPLVRAAGVVCPAIDAHRVPVHRGRSRADGPRAARRRSLRKRARSRGRL